MAVESSHTCAAPNIDVKSYAARKIVNDDTLRPTRRASCYIGGDVFVGDGAHETLWPRVMSSHSIGAFVEQDRCRCGRSIPICRPISWSLSSIQIRGGRFSLSWVASTVAGRAKHAIAGSSESGGHLIADDEAIRSWIGCN